MFYEIHACGLSPEFFICFVDLPMTLSTIAQTLLRTWYKARARRPHIDYVGEDILKAPLTLLQVHGNVTVVYQVRRGLQSALSERSIGSASDNIYIYTQEQKILPDNWDADCVLETKTNRLGQCLIGVGVRC